MRVEVHVVRSELLDIASSYALNIGNSVRCVMPRDNDKQNITCELERRSTTTNKHNCTTLFKSVLAWRQKSTPVITASLWCKIATQQQYNIREKWQRQEAHSGGKTDWSWRGKQIDDDSLLSQQRLSQSLVTCMCDDVYWLALANTVVLNC